MTNIEQLAERFAQHITFQLAETDLAEVKRRNATPEYARDICASHDFCDANMVMHAAFEELFGREPEVGGDTEESQKDVDLWNDAWELAKQKHLTA